MYVLWGAMVLWPALNGGALWQGGLFCEFGDFLSELGMGLLGLLGLSACMWHLPFIYFPQLKTCSL
jgi:hypothetical protein